MVRSLRSAVVALVTVASGVGAAAFAAEPRRIDHGDLIVLEVHGSHREMGRQIGELLGEDGRRVLELNLGFYRRSQTGGLGAWLFDHITLPVAARLMSDDTGVMDEAAGMAEAFGVSRADFLRSQIGAGTAAGSTVLAATRSATADGNALLARNVDWIDFGGLLKPTVVHYHPDDGDQEYLAAAWPLLQLPIVGVNESGVAFSFNYFATDPQSEPTSRSYPHRRVLQRARSVQEAIELFQADFPIVISAFGVVADAAGDIALLECTTLRCEVFRPEGDWFAHSNHARTLPMQPVDLFRGPDSLDRRRLMEAAFAPHAGRLDARRAAEILRNREGHAHPNASIVGNLFVLNAAIVEPARRVLWHSDLIQPYAPFGRYVPIAIDGHGADLEPIAASAFLETDAYRDEAREIARVRAAWNAHLVSGDPARASALWAEVFADPPRHLDASVLALGYAYGLLAAERFEDCLSVLARHVGSDATREASVSSALLRGACEDGRGRRDDAVASYARATALMDEVPDQTSYHGMRRLASTGRERPLSPAEVDLGGWLTHVPP